MPRIAVAALLLALAACAPRSPVQRVEGASMGTTWSAQFVAPDHRRTATRGVIANELEFVVAEMSAWEKDSDLTRFNASPAGTWVALPPGLFGVFEHALALARDTGGAYDPTIGPLAQLWGFGPGRKPRTAPPGAQEIQVVRGGVDHARVELDAVGHRALQRGGSVMDVSSLGPGHALDRVAQRLHEAGIDDFLVELGGEMIAAGRKPDGSDWRIAVEPAPVVDGEPHYDLVLALRDAAAGSSGDYRAGFTFEGRHYSHTIDPRSGEPVTHALAGVTVIAPQAMHADAMAAALMVMGPIDGMAFALRRDVAAVFTVRSPDGRLERRYTPAFEALRDR